MSPRIRMRLASVAVSITAVAIAATLPLAFYVPKLILVWEDSNYELAWWQVFLARSSQTVTAWGLPLPVILTVLFLGTLAWRVFLSVDSRRLAT